MLHTLNEFCDGLRENIVSYHSELLIATLLHDSSSHNWQNTKPFFEVSHNITVVYYTLDPWYWVPGTGLGLGMGMDWRKC